MVSDEIVFVLSLTVQIDSILKRVDMSERLARD